MYLLGQTLQVLMDETVFKEESVQRVYQYLKRRHAESDLDTFKLKYDPYMPEGKESDCLDCICR